MKNQRTIKLLEILMQDVKDVTYHSSDNMSYYMFSTNSSGLNIKFYTVVADVIAVEIYNKKNKKQIFYFENYKEIEHILEELSAKIETKINQMYLFPEILKEIEEEKENYKKALRREKMPNDVHVHSQNGYIYVHNKKSNVLGKIRFQKAITNNENKINNLLCHVGVEVTLENLNVLEIQNTIIDNKISATIMLCIPGFLLHKYPLLLEAEDTKIKDIRTNKDEDVWLNALVKDSVEVKDGFDKIIQYVLLSKDLKDDNNNYKKNKI